MYARHFTFRDAFVGVIPEVQMLDHSFQAEVPSHGGSTDASSAQQSGVALMNDDEFREVMKGKKPDEKKALLREYVQGRQVQIHMEFFRE